MATSRPFETSLYQAALYLYPPSFRREFSAEMVQDFHQARHEPHVRSGRRQLWAFRREMAMDFGRSLLVQWLRSGWPVILVLSLVGPLALTGAWAALLQSRRFVIPSGTPDEELIALFVMVLALLIVLWATIIFTFWFAHPVLRRRR
jgi:hypothetical protein